jgi:hypothetical protein
MSESKPMPPDTDMEVNDELDHNVEDEIKHDATQLDADAMNLDGANDTEPAAVNGMDMENSAAAFEARIPAKKDATLREFLGKMDEYAPIVRNTSLPGERALLMTLPDTRCRDKLLLDTRRSATTTSNLTAPCPPPCARNPEVHRGHCRRRLPVLAHTVVEHYQQQPHGWCCRAAWSNGARWSTRRQGQRIQGEGLQPRHPAARVRRWWSRWQPGTHCANHGGPGHGRRRVWRQHQAWGVLPLGVSRQGIIRPHVALYGLLTAARGFGQHGDMMAHYLSICIAGVRPVTGAGGLRQDIDIWGHFARQRAHHICTIAVQTGF